MNHKLTVKEAKRVEAVRKILADTVTKNVNELLENVKDTGGKVYFPDKFKYTFAIEDDLKVKSVFKTKSKTILGYCSYSDRKIVLNLKHVLLSDVEDIVDTILHECAHAVAYHLFLHAGHGKEFRKVSRWFGSTPRATSKSNDALTEEIENSSKYKIVVINHREKTVEDVWYCNRKLKNLAYRSMKNRPETKGMLWHVPTEVFIKSNSYENVVKSAFR